MHISIIIYSVYACLCKFCWHYFGLFLFLLCTAIDSRDTVTCLYYLWYSRATLHYSASWHKSAERGQWVPKAVGSDTDLACSANKYISSVSISPFLILPNPFLPSLPVCHSFLFRNVVHTATKLQQCRVVSVKCSPYCSDEWLFILDFFFFCFVVS